MSNKFAQLIASNPDQTLQRRAEVIATSAEIAQQNIVNALKQKKTDLELKITNLTDFAPESKDSLRPGGKDWNPKQWAADLQNAKQELYHVNIQLNIAQETYDEYFKEEQSK